MRWLKVAVVGVATLIILLSIGALLIWYVYPAADFWAVWHIYSGYVNTLSSLTGINRYLVSALALILFVPFYYGVRLILWSPFDKRRRLTGLAIVVGVAVMYNLSLYWVTREMAFSFATGAPQKWYALTPAGVRFFDRSGVDPEYGIPLKPVTPENIWRLRLIEKGEFKPIDPRSAVFFNPITGEAQVWYYRYPDGSLEFYDKPGFHPLTGTALQPITREIYLEWRKAEDVRQRAAKMSRSTQLSAGGAKWEPLPASSAKPRGAIKRELLPEPDTAPTGAVRQLLP